MAIQIQSVIASILCYTPSPVSHSYLHTDFEAFQKVKGALGLERKRSSGWRSVRKWSLALF